MPKENKNKNKSEIFVKMAHALSKIINDMESGGGENIFNKEEILSEIRDDRELRDTPVIMLTAEAYSDFVAEILPTLEEGKLLPEEYGL